MYTIKFNITNGVAPFTAKIVGKEIYIYPTGYGIYEIEVEECGKYMIRVTDAMNCSKTFWANCLCDSGTTTEEITTTEELTTTAIEFTTTTEETTTTLPIDYFFCGYHNEYYGVTYQVNQNWFVGADAGGLVFSVEGLNRPVRFILKDGVDILFDTGYIGQDSYQSALNAALILLGEPTETIEDVDSKTFAVEKTSATDTLRLEIYAPLSGAIAIYKITCVDDIDDGYYYGDWICVEEEELTTTEDVTTTE